MVPGEVRREKAIKDMQRIKKRNEARRGEMQI